jgi:hypothetical protein
MQNIQYLINQVGIIVKKNNEILDATGARFNMFRIVGVNHYENTHSAIITEFLNPKGSHGLKHGLLEIFINSIFKENPFEFNFVNARIKTEAPTKDGRIDILIEDDKNKAIIVENKVYASDQKEQLKRYNEFAQQKYGLTNYRILYLTLSGSEASMQSAEGVDYIQISYKKEIIDWLENSVSISSRFPLVRETLIQYINHLKQLTNQDMDMKNQEEIVEILSKPENIVSALKISANIQQAKLKIVKEMVTEIARQHSLKYEIYKDANGFGFLKDNWKEGSGIWFGESNNKTYYAIKTPEAQKGNAIPKKRIEELFEHKEIPYDPYGYGFVFNDHWKINEQLYVSLSNGTFANDVITPNLLKALDYINIHPEIEKDLLK